MIELNLTYEESKKILELGYDFASVCTKFEVKTDIEYHVNYGIIIKSDKWNRIEIESNRVIQDNGKLEHGQRIAFNPLSIPIIPKAALEACLPDDGNLKGLKWFGCSLYNPLYLFNLPNDGGLQYTINLSSFRVKSFKSAFEAFAWCHEHYPEELKKKFEEVMR